MGTLTIRDIDADLKARLRMRAAGNGRSMEAEVRAILRDTLARPSSRGLGSRIHHRFVHLGGDDLEVPPRTSSPRAAELPE